MNKPWPLDTAVSFDPYYGEPDRDGDQGYELLPDGRVFVRVKAPGAETVELDGNDGLLVHISFDV